METRFLIVNRNGVFSALPTEEEYSSGVYLTNPSQFLTYQIAIAPDDLAALWALRDDLMVIGPDLPLRSAEQITDPDNHYVQMVPGFGNAWSLQRVAVPESAYLAVAKVAKELALQKEGATIPQFTVEVAGEPRTYAPSVLAELGDPDWIGRETIGIACQVNGQPMVVKHTMEETKSVIRALGRHRVAHHNAVQDRLFAVKMANSRHELSLIN